LLSLVPGISFGCPKASCIPICDYERREAASSLSTADTATVKRERERERDSYHEKEAAERRGLASEGNDDKS
jgi:hypothetical protein